MLHNKTRKRLFKNAIEIYNSQRPHLSNQMQNWYNSYGNAPTRKTQKKTIQIKKAEQCLHCSALIYKFNPLIIYIGYLGLDTYYYAVSSMV